MLIVLTKILLSASPRTQDLRPRPLLSRSPSLLPLPLLPRLRRPLLLGLFPSLCITLSEAPAADQIICRFCHKPGHYARNCPERPPRPERREGSAYYCMLKRRARPRRFRRFVPYNTCYRCLQPGHLARDCQNEIVCSRCEQPGHKARECKNEPVCYRCKQSGHISSACPNPIVCYKCGQPGHKRSECTQA